MFDILDLTSKNVVAIKATGTITATDYKKIEPLVEKTVGDFGSVNLYIEIGDIKGFKPAAMWEDFKTYFKYVNKIEKMAIVGEEEWAKALTAIIKPWMKGEVKYFPVSNSTKAKTWLTTASQPKK